MNENSKLRPTWDVRRWPTRNHQSQFRGAGKVHQAVGWPGQYGDVWIKLEPKERGQGFEFVDEIRAVLFPRNISNRPRRVLKRPWKKVWSRAILWWI